MPAAPQAKLSDETRSKPSAKQAKPFLKWVGGKRQLLPVLLENVPERFGAYFEPMMGGGALFFALGAKKAFLSDINPELVNVYTVVRDEVEELIEALGRLSYSKEDFYRLRAADRSAEYESWSPVRRAARTIYLNKTCYNGLFRVNSRGHFNVPFGRYVRPGILQADVLRSCSAALQGVSIAEQSFEVTEGVAKRGDFVYFDPPYVPLNATSNFTSYSKSGFDTALQIELRDLCRALDRQGVKFMLSNSSAPLVLELYEEFSVSLIDASRAINCRADKRGAVKEVLVKNY